MQWQGLAAYGRTDGRTDGAFRPTLSASDGGCLRLSVQNPERRALLYALPVLASVHVFVLAMVLVAIVILMLVWYTAAGVGNWSHPPSVWPYARWPNGISLLVPPASDRQTAFAPLSLIHI